MSRNDRRAAQQGHRPPSPKGDILVVDDRADNLRLLSTMLSEQGYKVRKVIKGELTVEVAQVYPPDLILLDILMPNINGFEVCQRLKADPLTQAIPVIFLSALDEPLDKVKAFAVGGTDYITKPFEIQEVVARIEHQLSLVRLQKQLQEQNQQLQVEVAERQKAEAAIQRINEELEERVNQRTAELTQANRQLQQLGQQLQASLAQEQKLSQLKSHVITTISHEYRTPMAIISSSAGVLEEYLDKLTPELRHKHFVRIQAAIQRMTDLIDDVFFLNQLEFENYQLDLTQVDLGEIAGEIIAEIKSSTHFSHDIQFTADQVCQQQITDTRLITKILGNLLRNAIKFSPHSPSVDLQLTCTEENFSFKIEDAGIGIPEQEQSRIFESFYRASNTKNIQGVGLGLAIAQKCVSLLDGKVTIQSAIGLGSTITVSFPTR